VTKYGAKGDGVTDDTSAILNALTYNRSPNFSIKDPLLVYFPPGTYLISQTLPLWFYTHMVGNYKCPPTLFLKNGTFPNKGMNWVLSGDTSYDGDHDGEFYRSVSFLNIVIGAGNAGGCGIHWAESQATWIRNVTIDLGEDGNIGIFDENGSGGFASDLTILGGQTGLSVGNQQWTWLNVKIDGSKVACINHIWNWVSTWQGLELRNCPVGMSFTGDAVGSTLILDATAINVSTLLKTTPSTHVLLERLTLTNVETVVSGGATPFPGGGGSTLTVPAWGQGPWYKDGILQPSTSGPLPLTRPNSPLERRPRPTFDAQGSTIVNVYSKGAKGDGVTDDTAAIQSALAAPGGVVFLPCGTYLISDTLNIQSGGAIIGELNSILLANAASPVFSDAENPAPLLRSPPAPATASIVDVMFSTSGDAPGCILLNWLSSSSAGGLWDVEWRMYHGASDLLIVEGPGSGVYFEEGCEISPS